MSHYTLAWHDSQDVEQHICEYANDAFEAVKNARKDVRVDTEHPLLRVLQLPMRHSHIRLFHSDFVVGRANLVCNGT